MIYFDHAATSMPKHTSVGKSMLKALEECGNSGRSGHKYAVTASMTVYNCRKMLSEMFNTRPELVIFTSGATEALNIAIKGTNRPQGVTVVSSMEHNSVMRPLNSLRLMGETVLRQFFVNVDSDAMTLENFSAVTHSATSVVVTHASNVCGRILPIKQMRSLTDDSTVFIVDASQTAGHIPIDIVDLGADIICIPAHKGLRGPMGLGALIINPYSDIIIDPLLEGGTGTDSKSLLMPELYPERLEAGTQNVIGIAGLLSALEEFEYPQNEQMLFEFLVSSMREMEDVTLYGAPKDNYGQYVPVLLFNKKGMDCEVLCDILARQGFALRAGFHCAPNAHRTLNSFDTGGVRISLGTTNRHSEVKRFLSVLSKIKTA